MEPLNGEKTHPLSAPALAELRKIDRHPVPRCVVSSSVANRLEREFLAKTVMLPSPFKRHKGESIAHLQITDAGKERIR